jgi:drug/metabolite transporter (DMT)-like permease
MRRRANVAYQTKSMSAPELLQGNRPLAGIAFTAAAIALMSGQDAILKWLTSGYSTMQILLIRGTVVALIAMLVLRADGGFERLATKRPWDHGLRCILNVVTVTLFITAIARLPLADVMALVMASPLFTLALSTVILRDKVGFRRWTACVIGFVGVLVMLRPSGLAFNLGGLAALAASFCYSCMVIQTRRLTTSEGTGTMMFYTAAAVLLVSGAIAPLDWVTPSTSDVLLMFAAGVAVGLGHYCLVQGYRYASPSVLAPIDYTALVWGMLLGWAVWDELPDLVTLLGAALVVASGLYVLHREARLARAA